MPFHSGGQMGQIAAKIACEKSRIMKTQVKALVVGGGAVGTSIAYHLAKAGWEDVMLLERDELTSGSTWHAAGLLPLFNMSYATTHIHDYSVKFYKTLEEETGLNAGFAVVGNLRMAQTQDRMDEYMVYASTAETVGVPFEWLTPEEIKERWPLIRTDDLKVRFTTIPMATLTLPMSRRRWRRARASVA